MLFVFLKFYKVKRKLKIFAAQEKGHCIPKLKEIFDKENRDELLENKGK